MSKERSNIADDLRKRAETLLAKSPEDFQPADLKKVNRLAHELAVHQAELELQNEELRNTQLDLKQARDRFAALFEYAPVGYVVLDGSGIIRRTNATWRTMLNRPDEDFRGTPFVEMLPEEDASIFLSRFRAFFRNPEGKRIFLRIKRNDAPPFHAQIEAKSRDAASEDAASDVSPRELMVIVSDISELQQARREIERRNDELSRTNDRLDHIYRVLLAIRNVNQLIVTEEDPARLIERACVILTEKMGYFNVWITLLGGEAALALGLPGRGRVSATASAGFGGGFGVLRERLEGGELPSCMRRALDSDGLIVSGEPTSDCPDCPLSTEYGGRAALARRLTFSGVTYGILTASVPAAYASNAEEQDLFDGLTRDLSFALHKILTERRLEESRRRYREIFEHSRDGFVMVNKEGRIIDANGAFCEMLGYSLDELRALPDFYEITPERWRGWQATEIWKKRLLGRGYSGLYEKEYIRKDGTVFPVELSSYAVRLANGEIDYLWGTARDITERKQAEEALRESEERFRFLIENLAEGVVLKDASDRYVHWNQKASEVFGIDIDELKGRSTESFKRRIVHEDGSDFKKDDLPSLYTLRTGKPCGNVVMGIKRGPEDTSWIKVNTKSHLKIGDDKPSGVIISFSDITELKKVENKLSESESRFRSFVENANDIIYALSPEGHFTYVSPNWKDFMGELPEEAMGKSFEPYVHPEDVHLCREFLERVVTNREKQSNVEYRVRHCNGPWRWHVSNGSPLWDANGTISGYLGIARDITEQKERDLEYAQILKAAIDGFWLIDMEGNLLEVNDAAAALLGYSRQEMTRLTINDIDAEEKPEETRLRIHQVREKGSARFETLHKRKDGALVEVEVSTSLSPMGGGRMVAFTRDISERKRVEREERLNNARLEISQKIATMPEASEKDICDFVLESMLELTDSTIGFLGFMDESEEVMEIHAWSPSAMAECTIHDKPIEFPVAKAGLWGEPIRNRGPIIVNDYSAPHFAKNGIPEGHTDISRFMAIPVFDGDRIVAVSAVGNRTRAYENADMTQLMLLMESWWEQIRLRRINREKELLQSQLSQAHKMESVGRLAGGVAHDFNNMLGIILGHTDMALEYLDPGQPLHSDLTEIRKATMRSADLVRQLLAFARKQTIAPKVLDLNDTVEGMLKMLRRLIGEDIHLVWHPGADLWPVNMDPTQIDQVLANLCVNARDAIDGVGKVTIETDNVTMDEDYLSHDIGAITPGDYVLLAVSDDGCGMDKEILGKLFEPFFTTKEVDKGTGLGLSTIYGIVKQNEGFIHVYSEPGQGTTFRIYIPRHIGEAEREQKQVSDETILGGHETILLVEDDPMLLEMGKEMLQRLGYRVISAGRPSEVLQIAAEHKEEIHLLITDVIMPVMNGRELADQLKAAYPDMKLLFMSGYTADVIAHHGVLDFGVKFIQKPFSMKDLANRIREALEG